MSITQKDVEHIAHLARIELTDAQKEKFSGELSGILSFIEQLDRVPTDDVLPLSGGSLLENVVRADDLKVADIPATDLLENVPELENGYVRVKAVFQ